MTFQRLCVLRIRTLYSKNAKIGFLIGHQDIGQKLVILPNIVNQKRKVQEREWLVCWDQLWKIHAFDALTKNKWQILSQYSFSKDINKILTPILCIFMLDLIKLKWFWAFKISKFPFEIISRLKVGKNLIIVVFLLFEKISLNIHTA